MHHLFAYGSLMCPDIMGLVSGLSLPGEPAVLTGYRRCKVRGEPYPAVLVDSDASVTGILYRNLNEPAWQRLDRFEGEMYRRLEIQVRLGDESCARAGVYVIQPAYHHHLSLEDWSFDEFLREGKARFECDYRGFDSL
jgi:gamma-glutamylcyclotransferase (GGCT)/AIG2-like uncharacterized protein YtfP